jgi:hypothetical protein
VARGEMNPAMVGFRVMRECAGCTLMPFLAVPVVSYNVQRFLMAREPTEGRRRAIHRFSVRLTTSPAVTSGRRPRRRKRVLGGANVAPRTLPCQERSAPPRSGGGGRPHQRSRVGARAARSTEIMSRWAEDSAPPCTRAAAQRPTSTDETTLNPGGGASVHP